MASGVEDDHPETVGQREAPADRGIERIAEVPTRVKSLASHGGGAARVPRGPPALPPEGTTGRAFIGPPLRYRPSMVPYRRLTANERRVGMGYLEQCLIPDEEVRYRAGLHVSVVWGHILAGIALDLAGAAALVAWAIGDPASPKGGPLPAVGAVLLLLGTAVLAAGVVTWRSTEIVVTTRRVLIKSGILNRRTVELLLSKIERVDVTETVAGRVFGFGKVVLRGTGGTPESFDRIASPLEFRRQIQAQVDGLTRGREAHEKFANS
jgi:hypothetical protein